MTVKEKIGVDVLPFTDPVYALTRVETAEITSYSIFFICKEKK